MPTVLMLVLMIALVLAPSPGAAADSKLPEAVTKALQGVAAQCTEVGGKPSTETAVTRVDLNGDGKEDFVLDVSMVNCDGAASIYGDREKSVVVYVGDGAGGAVEAFNDNVFGVKVEGTGSAAKLWVGVSGAQCGKPPAPDFARENFCDRALVWNAATKKFDYALVSTVRMIQ